MDNGSTQANFSQLCIVIHRLYINETVEHSIMCGVACVLGLNLNKLNVMKFMCSILGYYRV